MLKLWNKGLKFKACRIQPVAYLNPTHGNGLKISKDKSVGPLLAKMDNVRPPHGPFLASRVLLEAKESENGPCGGFRRPPHSLFLASRVLLEAMEVLLGATFSTGERIDVAADKSVLLHCKTDRNDLRMIWKYNEKLLLQKYNSHIYRGTTSVMYKLKEETFSLELTKAKPGQYTCHVGQQQVATYDIEVWTVTGSKSGYLLQGDTLKMQLSPVKETGIVWFDPHKTEVAENEPRWKLRKNILQILNLTVQDNGKWECCISEYKINLFYNVKVLGFSNPSDEFQFAATNSNTCLSCPLNIDLQDKRDPEIPKVQSWKWLKNNILMKEHNVSNINRSFSIQQISNVHSEDAGQYQCHLGFKHGILRKNINLIVVKVSAIPPALRSKEDNVTLCGHISPSAPPLIELCWVYVNDSTSEPKCGSPISENKFCHVATTEGLWRCDFKVNNNVKISIDYILGKFSNETLDSSFSLIKTASGIGAMLLLLILIGVCVPTCKRIKQKQQQAKRMAQIKQHLLAKKTCQCQRDLPNDYYHT
ncbi:T-cell surface glycoprotein CD4 [Erythrolamprus reginae]|uniref:T-cell surface glycoprotein CD4 n=1 Tax=Erythrolamprus reginae TaxID=121349 RepID=UPI00396C354A